VRCVCFEMSTKTSRAGSRQQQQQQQQPRRTHRDKNRDEDEDEDDDDKSQDSLDSPPSATSPRCLSRDDVLATLGYRSGNVPQSAPLPQAQRSTACRRCAKKVYPLELIDIGDCYHRGCFKCNVSVSAI